MSSNTTRRILKDLKEIEQEQNDYFKILPNEDNIYEWQGYFLAPEDSYYSGSIIPIRFVFPKDYPSKPP
jgi:ubiquitin-protein ligase